MRNIKVLLVVILFILFLQNLLLADYPIYLDARQQYWWSDKYETIDFTSCRAIKDSLGFDGAAMIASSSIIDSSDSVELNIIAALKAKYYNYFSAQYYAFESCSGVVKGKPSNFNYHKGEIHPDINQASGDRSIWIPAGTTGVVLDSIDNNYGYYHCPFREADRRFIVRLMMKISEDTDTLPDSDSLCLLKVWQWAESTATNKKFWDLLKTYAVTVGDFSGHTNYEEIGDATLDTIEFQDHDSVETLERINFSIESYGTGEFYIDYIKMYDKYYQEMQDSLPNADAFLKIFQDGDGIDVYDSVESYWGADENRYGGFAASCLIDSMFETNGYPHLFQNTETITIIPEPERFGIEYFHKHSSYDFPKSLSTDYYPFRSRKYLGNNFFPYSVHATDVAYDSTLQLAFNHLIEYNTIEKELSLKYGSGLFTYPSHLFASFQYDPDLGYHQCIHRFPTYQEFLANLGLALAAGADKLSCFFYFSHGWVRQDPHQLGTNGDSLHFMITMKGARLVGIIMEAGPNYSTKHHTDSIKKTIYCPNETIAVSGSTYYLEWCPYDSLKEINDLYRGLGTLIYDTFNLVWDTTYCNTSWEDSNTINTDAIPEDNILSLAKIESQVFDSSFIQMGSFIDTSDHDSLEKYFTLVNRRCLPTETETLDIYFSQHPPYIHHLDLYYAADSIVHVFPEDDTVFKEIVLAPGEMVFVKGCYIRDDAFVWYDMGADTIDNVSKGLTPGNAFKTVPFALKYAFDEVYVYPSESHEYILNGLLYRNFTIKGHSFCGDIPRIDSLYVELYAESLSIGNCIFQNSDNQIIKIANDSRIDIDDCRFENFAFDLEKNTDDNIKTSLRINECYFLDTVVAYDYLLPITSDTLDIELTRNVFEVSLQPCNEYLTSILYFGDFENISGSIINNDFLTHTIYGCTGIDPYPDAYNTCIALNGNKTDNLKIYNNLFLGMYS